MRRTKPSRDRAHVALQIDGRERQSLRREADVRAGREAGEAERLDLRDHPRPTRERDGVTRALRGARDRNQRLQVTAAAREREQDAPAREAVTSLNGTPFAHSGHAAGSKIRLGNDANVSSATPCDDASARADSPYTASDADRDRSRAAARERLERAAHRGAGVDHVVHDRDALSRELALERLRESVRHGKQPRRARSRASGSVYVNGTPSESATMSPTNAPSTSGAQIAWARYERRRCASAST